VSPRLGVASLRLQRVIAAKLLRAGISVILEGNFVEVYDGALLRALASEYVALVV
jgi:predicted kinase